MNMDMDISQRARQMEGIRFLKYRNNQKKITEILKLMQSSKALVLLIMVHKTKGKSNIDRY